MRISNRSVWLAAVLLPLVVIAGVYLLLYAPGDAADTDQGITYLIGMSQANLIEPWRITMNQEIEATAQKTPDLRVIVTDAAGSTERQIEDVRMLMGYGIDLLVISPNESGALTPIIREVYRDIPVIVLDRDVQGEDYTLFIGPNNYQIGRRAGELVLRLLGEQGGNIVEILGTEGSPPVAERSAGFADAISQSARTRVIKQLGANWMQDEAEARFKEYIVIAEEPIDVVFAHNDAMAYGAYLATDKFRGSCSYFVGVDGLDGDNGGVALVKRGVLAGTFYCPTGGKQAIEYAIRILRGESGLEKRLILDPTEITSVV